MLIDGETVECLDFLGDTHNDLELLQSVAQNLQRRSFLMTVVSTDDLRDDATTGIAQFRTERAKLDTQKNPVGQA